MLLVLGKVTLELAVGRRNNTVHRIQPFLCRTRRLIVVEPAGIGAFIREVADSGPRCVLWIKGQRCRQLTLKDSHMFELLGNDGVWG